MSETESKPYQVLARKYRPQVFSELVGQDAMVQVMRNAFAADRVAHAFMLTGVRGVGKTTAARIIAKGLNCVGADGQGEPTTEPCGVCQNCQEISSGSHIDVMEMDAASRTGVGDIREIIESVAYKAAAGRCKIYIVDEVHMLSNSAFNALLKTLEEPPPHVKFIFATTEIRSVPVTVLSRCQRFDLRRIEPETLTKHLDSIARAEGVTVSDDALALIVRAAEGSVRDALSLLDQAIAHGSGQIETERVRDMLALADRGRIIDLFDLIMKGDSGGAIEELSAQYRDGADPLAVLRELASLAHWVSVIKFSPAAADDPTASPDERRRGRELADKLSLPILARIWQMLLKSMEELPLSPTAIMAAEMAVLRLTHVADLPTPAEIIRQLESEGDGNPSRQPPPVANREQQAGPASAGHHAQPAARAGPARSAAQAGQAQPAATEGPTQPAETDGPARTGAMASERERVEGHPLVQSVKKDFPGSTLHLPDESDQT